MDPVLRHEPILPERRRNIRLAVLLHEALHAFLDNYFCDKCPTYKHDVDQVGGHANVFMEIATIFKSEMEKYLEDEDGLEKIAEPADWLSNWRMLNTC